MSNKVQSAFAFLRVLFALSLVLTGCLLAMFSVGGGPSLFGPAQTARPDRDRDSRPKYMPTRGEKGEDLSRMEEEWNNRLTYPTGHFNPAWLRQAAAQDAKISRNIPLGAGATALFKDIRGNTVAGATAQSALDPARFTALGPAPIQMTGCFLCYDYTKTQGRVNTIAVDPTKPRLCKE